VQDPFLKLMMAFIIKQSNIAYSYMHVHMYKV